ncbi:MAG: c-type cytochrome [Terriglobia bacterium]
MKRFLLLLGLPLAVLAVAAGQEVSPQEPPLYDPYERPKNGPPLTNVFHKVQPSWLLQKLREPKHHPSARMPDFKFSHDEALDIMAYLKSIAQEPRPRVSWPAWVGKTFDEMEEEEIDAAFELVERGQAVWGDARCTICHKVNGPGGSLIGGFVDLRVGGIDLQIAATKLKRDWLYEWLKEPKDYFPDTLMPRYRFSDSQIKALVEFILRDDTFLPSTNEEEEEESPELWQGPDDPQRLARGKRLIVLSRCVLCHDIQGIPEVLSWTALKPPPPARSIESLVYDLRCLSCHSIEGRGGTYAPDLTGEGSRLQEAWVAKFVESPDMIRPLSQQMPKFNLTAEEAKIIASYLDKRRVDARIPTRIPGGRVTSKEVQRGRKAFQSRGCFSCHTTGEGPGGVVGPDLALVRERLTPGYIWFHLKNPHAVNPYSPEPDYGLSDEDARALAAYLAARKQ